MATRTRWGILATGGIADAFAADLALLPQAELVAVGSRTQQAAETFAARHGIPRGYGSWAQLAADPDLDVIYVATPHTAHHAAATLCLRAGKAVLCEKPLTLTLAGAQDLVATARAGGRFLMEAMWTRTLPAIRRLRELIADGAIGEITAVYADFALGGDFPPTHRLRAPELGGGALLDLGVYPITFAHLFLGVPDRIAASATLSPAGVDENTGILLHYPTGAVATLHCGIVGPSGATATIVGTKGRVVIDRDFFRTDRFTLIRGAAMEELALPWRGNGLGYEAEEVMACLSSGQAESDLVPLSATLAVMRIMDEVRAQIGVEYPPEG